MNLRNGAGYVPAAIVFVPFAVAWIRQALYYKGCMDGAGYVYAAMLAFLIGGVLNLAYLAFLALTRSRGASASDRVPGGGLWMALVTFAFQLAVLIYVFFPRLLGG